MRFNASEREKERNEVVCVRREKYNVGDFQRSNFLNLGECISNGQVSISSDPGPSSKRSYFMLLIS